jgi:hypothetical protein
MAEQSMFWPTTGTGDGISGGYTADRLAAIWDAVIGEGVLYYLNRLSATGIGTTSLSIDTGAAIVSGYLYENTSTATITTSTLGSATYGLYIIANEGTTALTVNRSVAGTTVAAKTVRLALSSTVPSQPYIHIAQVTTVAGAITTINERLDNRPALSRAYPYYQPIVASEWSGLYGTLSISNSTITTLTDDGSSSYGTSNEFLDFDGGTNSWTVLQSGNYAITISVTWDTNTTNRRRLIVSGFRDAQMQLSAASFIHTTSTVQTMTHIDYYDAGDTIVPQVWQDSGSTRTISIFSCKVARM